MTITLSDLYNEAASQEWSMYDSGAGTKEEMEQSLLIALNKAITEILYSYPFGFRERTHLAITFPGVDSYDVPKGLISKDSSGRYLVRVNSGFLRHIEEPSGLVPKSGIPKGFYFTKGEMVLYPTPCDRFILTVDYLSLAIGEDSNGDEIFAFKDVDDKVLVPEYLEEIFKQAVISRAMLYVISAESDENYSAYKKQSEIAYRQLVKYSKGIDKDKEIRI